MKNKSKKFFLTIPVIFFIVISVCFYTNQYINTYELNFTGEHRFILLTFVLAVLFICSILSFVLFRQFRMENKLNEYKLILEDIAVSIADAEDNTIKVSRQTQMMVLKLSGDINSTIRLRDKIGDDGYDA